MCLLELECASSMGGKLFGDFFFAFGDFFWILGWTRSVCYFQHFGVGNCYDLTYSQHFGVRCSLFPCYLQHFRSGGVGGGDRSPAHEQNEESSGKKEREEEGK